MYKLFLDTETIGINPACNALIQVAGILFKDDSKIDEFNFHCRPFQQDIILEKDLEFHEKLGLTKEQIFSFEDPKITHGKFVNFLSKYVDKFNKKDKMFFVGYNARFDYDFLREWFNKNGDNYFGSWFWNPPIDIMTLSADFLDYERPSMDNFKQLTVADKLGIRVNESSLHDALYDIGLSVKIYSLITDYKFVLYNGK